MPDRRHILTQVQCDRLRRLCQIHSMRTAATIVGVQFNTVRAVRDRGWQAARGAKALRARPSDFAIQARYLKRRELAAHYRASGHTVARWAAEIGLGRWRPERTRPAMQVPDGSDTAIAALGDRGTPAALDRAIRERGVAGACDLYAVSQGTLRRWRMQLGLPFSWSRHRRRPVVRSSMVGWADRYHQERAHG